MQSEDLNVKGKAQDKMTVQRHRPGSIFTQVMLLVLVFSVNVSKSRGIMFKYYFGESESHPYNGI